MADHLQVQKHSNANRNTNTNTNCPSEVWFILKVVVAGDGRRVSSTHQHFFQGGRLLLAHPELPPNRIPMWEPPPLQRDTQGYTSQVIINTDSNTNMNTNRSKAWEFRANRIPMWATLQRLTEGYTRQAEGDFVVKHYRMQETSWYSEVL